MRHFKEFLYTNRKFYTILSCIVFLLLPAFTGFIAKWSYKRVDVFLASQYMIDSTIVFCVVAILIACKFRFQNIFYNISMIFLMMWFHTLLVFIGFSIHIHFVVWIGLYTIFLMGFVSFLYFVVLYLFHTKKKWLYFAFLFLFCNPLYLIGHLGQYFYNHLHAIPASMPGGLLAYWIVIFMLHIVAIRRILCFEHLQKKNG